MTTHAALTYHGPGVDSATVVRRVDLPDGRALVVRPGTPADICGLSALYAGLSDDDVYLRFFSAHRPDAGLFERMTSVRDRGGELLVVEVEEDGEPTVVGDAWYAPLPDGNAEFAITVAERWRGWLGAFLFDALLDVAGSRGIPNLEGEIMLRNRPMMRLARRRGCVRLADDGSAVRVEIATDGAVPSWPPNSRRPRVLVEGRTGWRAQETADRRGLDVPVCPGPQARGGRCPVLEGRRCPLVDGADAVVVALAADDDVGRDLLQRHRDRHPHIALLAEGRPTAPLGAGITLLPAAASEDAVVDVLLAEIARRNPEVSE